MGPNSDPTKANSLHPGRREKHRTTSLPVAIVTLFTLLGACERAPQGGAELQEPEVVTEQSCGSNGRLSTQLYGSIERQISWSSAEFQCESMLRPEGKGIRLRLVGDAADSQIAIILALPELQRGSTGRELPTVATLTVEGSGRFFSTPSLESCWTDVATQDLIEDSGNRYDISGTLYCVAPLGEINGDAAISIPELEFRGIVDWSAK
jgi:hypothetical protein